MNKIVRFTVCKGRRTASCNHNPSCKMALGPKRSFCRRKNKSACKGLRASYCKKRKSCKMASGNKRSFCRKNTNKKRKLFIKI